MISLAEVEVPQGPGPPGGVLPDTQPAPAQPGLDSQAETVELLILAGLAETLGECKFLE